MDDTTPPSAFEQFKKVLDDAGPVDMTPKLAAHPLSHGFNKTLESLGNDALSVAAATIAVKAASMAVPDEYKPVLNSVYDRLDEFCGEFVKLMTDLDALRKEAGA